MKNTIKKAILFGLGTLEITKEKIEKFVKRLKEEEGLSGEEGKELIKEMTEELEENKEKIDKKLRERMEKMIDDLGLATKEDLKDLENKVKKSE